MKTLHVTHQGQVCTLRRARQTVYWPNITQDIRTTMEQGERCAERQASQPTQPLVVKAIHLIHSKVLQLMFSVWREGMFWLSCISTRDGQSSHHFDSTVLPQLMLFGQ